MTDNENTSNKSLAERVKDQIKKLQSGDNEENETFSIPALSKKDLDALGKIDTTWYDPSQYSNMTTNSYATPTTGVTTVTLTGGGGAGGGGSYYPGTSTTGTYYTGTVPAPGTITTTMPGSTGQYMTGGLGSGPMWTGTTTPNANVRISGKNPKIQTDKNEIDLDETAELIKILKERLLILIPNFEKHEKYQALKKAYDHYKMIEALIQEEKIDVK